LALIVVMLVSVPAAPESYHESHDPQLDSACDRLRGTGSMEYARTMTPADSQLSELPTDTSLLAQAQAVAECLLARGQTMVTAESCTGGWIAKTLTDIAGSSAWFECGVVAYSYEAKESLLGVQPQTLERTGAVSQETVVEMVSGALARYGASVAVAVTGIAGPSGGTPGKPVGTVWIGWKRRGGYARAELFHFDGDREAVRRQTVAAALEGVRRILTS
jgi:nicotinamide-nucleotide amidase